MIGFSLQSRLDVSKKTFRLADLEIVTCLFFEHKIEYRFFIRGRRGGEGIEKKDSRTYLQTRSNSVSLFFALSSSIECCFSFRVETYRRNVCSASNFSDLKHFSFSSSASPPSPLLFRVFVPGFQLSSFPLFSPIREAKTSSRNVARTTVYFLLRPRFSRTSREVSALAT